MNQSANTESRTETYQRSSPLVIISYFFRNFSLLGTGQLLGKFVSSTGVTAGVAGLTLWGLSAIGVHWSWRLTLLILGVLATKLVTSIIKFFTFQFRADATKISTTAGFATRKTIDFDWFQVRSILFRQSRFQRRLKLASVSLVTAGESDNTIEIPYIPVTLAREWEHRVKEQVEQTDAEITAAGTADIVSAASAELETNHLHELNGRELWQANFVNGNILSEGLGGFLVLGITYGLIRLLHQILMSSPDLTDIGAEHPFEFFGDHLSKWFDNLQAYIVADATRLLEYVQSVSGISLDQNLFGRVLFFASVSILVAIVFYLLNRIIYFIYNYDLELTKSGMNLALQRGLFTRRELTIRRDRVQKVSFTTNFIEPSINRGDLTLDQASSNNDHAFTIPFVTTAGGNSILRLVQGDSLAELTLSPSKQWFTSFHVMSLVSDMMFRTVIGMSLFLLFIALVIPVFRDLLWPYSLLLYGFSVISTFVRWQRKGYRIQDDFLWLRTGSIGARQISVSPLKKVQQVSIKQNWIQRPRNRATIKFHYVPREEEIPYLDLPVAEAMKSTVEATLRGDTEEPSAQTEEDELAVSWRQLPKRYIVRRAVGKFLTSITLFIPLFVVIAVGLKWTLSISYDQSTIPLTIAWSVLVLWRIVVVCLKVPKYRYGLSSDGLTTKESFLSKQTEVVRFSRAQAVTTDNSLIDRLFRLSNLTLYTAASDVWVRGLPSKDAYRFREFIAAQMMQTASTSSDALSMTATSTKIQNTQANEIDQVVEAKVEESCGDHEENEWRKFTGWWYQLIPIIGAVTVGIPMALLIFGIPIFIVVVALLSGPDSEWFAVTNDLDSVAVISNLDSLSWPIFFGIWGVVAAWFVQAIVFSIPFKRYLVSDTALRYKEGFLARRYEFIPLSRIQNVKISSHFLQRLFKLRAVTVETANHSITLEYLSEVNAEELRKQLLNRGAAMIPRE